MNESQIFTSICIYAENLQTLTFIPIPPKQAGTSLKLADQSLLHIATTSSQRRHYAIIKQYRFVKIHTNPRGPPA